MKELNKGNKIDRYVTNKLEDAELWEFKHEMETNPDLAKEVALRKDIYNAISDKQKLNLRKSLIELKNKKQHQPRFIFSWKMQAVAASIMVFLLVGAGLFTNIFKSTNNHDLFESYYHPESSLLSVRSGNISDNTSLNLAMLSYDQGQYDESIEIFKSIPDNLVARLYCGFAYMNVKNFEAAITEFNYVVKHGDNLFTDQAEWNIGLSYLANNKIAKATSILKTIANQEGAYSSKASELLDKLKNNQ